MSSEVISGPGPLKRSCPAEPAQSNTCQTAMMRLVMARLSLLQLWLFRHPSVPVFDLKGIRFWAWMTQPPRLGCTASDTALLRQRAVHRLRW